MQFGITWLQLWYFVGGRNGVPTLPCLNAADAESSDNACVDPSQCAALAAQGELTVSLC
jgi:hypothetical protein